MNPTPMDTRIAHDIRTPSSFVTFKLARLQSSLNAQAIHLLKSKAGLSLVEWRVIQAIRIFEDATMTEISSLVQMDKGQLSRKLKAMISKGLLRAEQDQADQRVQHLHLTAEAERLSDVIMPSMQARQELLLGKVSPEDLATFYSVIEKLEKASKVRDIE